MYRSNVLWRPTTAALLAVLLNVWAIGCGDDPLTPSALPSFDVVGTEEVAAVFTVTTTGNAGPGSLRQAILDANASPGRDGIAFSISGAGPHVILLFSALPAVTEAVVLDGYTQPGATPNTNPAALGTNAALRVALDGIPTGGTIDGLVIATHDAVVRGLTIQRVRDGVVVAGNDNRVEGNFIGVNVAGTGSGPNFGHGVRILGARNVVGGDDAASRNILSGNRGDGVLITGAAAVGNRVEGNYLGTDATGAVAIPNGLPEPAPANSAAVHINGTASSNVVGGPGAMPESCTGPCNVISGNHRSGVWIEDFARHNEVQGNLIGLQASGTGRLGNSRWGIIFGGIAGTTTTDNSVLSNRIAWNGRDGILFSTGAGSSTVGGLDVTPGKCDGVCNVIAFNGQRTDTQGDGVRIAPAALTRISVLGNSIFSNPTGTGIDFGLQGVTPNDVGDIDVGPNLLQNFPVLHEADVTPGRLVVSGTIDTPAPETVLVELFANEVPVPGGDPSGYGEGALFLGRAVPDADGYFSAHLPSVPPGTLITATATDAAGNTSEFAANVKAMPPRGPQSDRNEQWEAVSFRAATCEEFVDVTGSLRWEDHDGQTHYTFVGVGIGMSSGAVYNINETFSRAGHFFSAGAETFTFVHTLSLIGRGGTADYQLRVAFHVTVTPDGTVKITVDNASERCG